MAKDEIAKQEPNKVVVQSYTRSAPTPPAGYDRVKIIERERITTYERNKKK